MNKTSPLINVLIGIRTILLANGFSKFLLLAIEFFIAYSLGAAFFGLYAITQSVIALTSVICLMGINYGIIQYLAIYEEKNDLTAQRQVILQALTFLLSIGLCGAGLLYLLKDYLVLSLFKKEALLPLFTLTVFIIPIDTVNHGLGAIFRGLRQYKSAMLSTDLIRNITLSLGLPVLIFLDCFTLHNVLYIYMLGSSFGAFYGLQLLYRQKRIGLPFQFDTTVFRSLFGFSSLLFIFHILQILSSRLLILGAGVFLSSAETGILGVGIRLTLFITFFQTAVGSTVQTEFSRFQDKKDYDGQLALFQNVTRGLFCVAAAVSLLFLTAPNYILGFIGEDYAGYGWVIWPLLLATAYNVVTGPIGQTLVANHKQKELVIIVALDLIMTVAIILPAMSVSGLEGGIIAHAATLAFLVTYRLYVCYKLLKIHPFTQSYLLLSTLFAGCIITGVSLNILNILTPLGAILVTLMIYFAALFILIFKNKDMQDQLKAILKF